MKKKAAIIFTVLMLALTAGLTGCGRNDVDTPDAGDYNVTEEERKAGELIMNSFDAVDMKYAENIVSYVLN